MLKYYRHIFLLLILIGGVITAGSVQAQGQYGNEWINYSQTYHKLKVTNTGLHRLSYGYLDSLGLAGVNPRQLQLFRRGREVAIYVAGEADGKLDTQDFVEFYGERNDGALDAELYKNPTDQMHQFFSLYTDTAAYFLTYSATGGKRMVERNPSASGRTPEPHFIQKSLHIDAGRFYLGKAYVIRNLDGPALENRMSWMDEGEGYASHSSRNPKSYTIQKLTNISLTGSKPRLEYVLGASNQIKHDFNLNILLPGGGSRQLGRHEIVNDGFIKGVTEIEFSDIATDRITVQTVPDGHATTQNQISFAYGRVIFPQKTTFSGGQVIFYTDSLRASNPYFILSGAPTTSVAYDVSDPYNAIRIEGHAANGGKGFVISSGVNTHKVMVANTTKPFKPAASVKNVRFSVIDPAAHNYIIITNKLLLRKAIGSDLTAPEEYAAYRESKEGGSYKTLLLEMNQIVDQFHYGEFSSNSIKKLMQFMATSPQPKHLFLLGKGLKYAANEYQAIYGGRFSYYHVGGRHPKIHELDLVPTGISPSSDIFFTADFRNGSYTPTVPTGRLAATSPEDIISYLNKVKEYEATPEGLPWRKNILQLGGGTTGPQINSIARWLSNYKSVAEKQFLGAYVIEKYRQNVSQTVEAINVAEEVNNGLSLMTFFGHSSRNTNDLDIGLVSNPINGYNNKGKYPVILMNGCSAGDAFVPGDRSFGEDWLLTPDKGAVAFIAHLDAGGDELMNNYSQIFYEAAFKDPDFYGKTIGEVQEEVTRRVYANSRAHQIFSIVAVITQMALQGDPAIRLYTPSKPDYLVQNNGLSLQGKNNEVITSDHKSFVLTIKAKNLGKALTDTVTVSVKRTLADNTIINYDPVKIYSIFYNRDIVVPIKNDGVDALGLNKFEVKLDSPNEFDELNESNNTASFQHFFPVNGLFTLTPSEFGIVNSNNITLTAQATKLDGNRNGYIFEVDTTHTFRSSVKKTFTAGNELLPSINVDLKTVGNFADSTVYFWRVRFKNYPAGEDTVWATSSFRFINGTRKGWSQSHRGQLGKSKTERLVVENTKPYFNFLPQKSEIIIKTKGGTGFSIPPHGLFVDGKQQIESYPCSDPWTRGLPRLYMVVINDKTLQQVEGLGGAVICPAYPAIYEFGDLNNANNRARVETFIKGIPAGYHVAVVSVMSVPFKSFTASQKEAFKSLGSSMIDNLEDGAAFALVGRKGGASGTAQEEYSNELTQDVSLRVELASKQGSGIITSTDIGPALDWNSLHHTIRKNQAGDDAYTLSVWGKKLNGQLSPIEGMESVTSRSLDLNIDAKEYPYLQLRAELSDPTDRTAPQLEEWMVLYTEAPEGVIRPDMVTVSGPSLSEQANKGSIKVPMVFQNISTTAFSDSIEVEVTVTGEGITADDYNPVLKLKPLDAKSHVDFEFVMPTLKLSGDYLLRINVNPRKQPEQHYFNNIYEVQFEVDRKLHPVMDVAFDGVHIMDGELVSPSPVISVIVKDQNKHVFLEGPAGMSMRLITGGDSEEIQLLDNPEVKFFPADEKNDFRLEYKPGKMLENGTHTLEVNAKDVMDKSAGISPYRISFEVENESTITNFYPYPNPFSTKTQFIFTLTGATIPDNMKIQILTVTGKVVKEIMKDEIGPVRIGNNKTAYAWDGTDTFGDKLANGVYLYRVVLSQDAGDIRHKNKVSDKAFSNGYGKLYILR